MRGFERYPQKPSPNPQAVGQALMQGGQRAQAPQPMMPPMGQMADGPMFSGDDTAMTRLEGARYMGGKDADEVGDGFPSATNAAIGEALSRMGNGYRTNPNPFKNRSGHMERLQQLGLSEVEARLLGETGGF